MRPNHYRHRRVAGKVFVSTDHGSWVLLTPEEFAGFERYTHGDATLPASLQQKLLERELIIDERNTHKTARLMRDRYRFLFEAAGLHIVIPTLRCNQHCVYCHAASRQEQAAGFDMTIATAHKVVDVIFQSSAQSIHLELQGGEPLLNWGVCKELVTYAERKALMLRKDLACSVVTNLTLMDEEKLSFLLDHAAHICTSLDGPKELHDANRPLGPGGSHAAVTHWISCIKEALRQRQSNRSISALTTLTKRSLAYPTEIVDEYARLGLTMIHLRPLNRLGVADARWSEVSYSAEEYLSFWEIAMARIGELRRQGIDLSERMINVISHKLNYSLDPDYLDLRSPCGACIGQLAYQYDGNVYCCDEARSTGGDLFLLGNVATHSYQQLVTQEKSRLIVSSSMNDQYLCDSCAYKPFCGVCPVLSYAEHGSVVPRIPGDRCAIIMRTFDRFIEENYIKPTALEQGDAAAQT